jgi:hypothetical protein
MAAHAHGLGVGCRRQRASMQAHTLTREYAVAGRAAVSRAAAAAAEAGGLQSKISADALTPREIFEQLEEHIIGCAHSLACRGPSNACLRSLQVSGT